MFRSIQDKSHAYGFCWGRYLVIVMAVLFSSFTTASNAHAQAPEIEVQGSNSQVINTPDTTPSTTDGTDFGAQGVGVSRNELFFIINQGDADLTVTNPVISGAGAGDFRIISNPASPVSANSQTDFALEFTPSSTGLKRATVTFTTNDANEGTFRFDVQGTGSVVPGSFTAASGNNQSAIINSVYAQPLIVTLLDTSNNPISGASIQFAATGNDLFPSVVFPNGNSTFTVVTDANGQASASVTANSVEGDHTVTAVTAGVPQVGFSLTNTILAPEIVIRTLSGNISTPDTTPSIGDGTDYGSVEIGDVLDRAFIIQNTGSADLTFSSPIISGPDAADFTLTFDPASPISAGGQDNFIVRFTPSRLGAHNATFSFTNNDSDENPFTFDLAGAGINEPPRISSIDQIIGGSPTNADEVIWRIIFSEQGIQNLTTDDFQVSGTTATLSVRAGPTDNPGSSFGTLFDLRLSGGDLAELNGNVTLSLASGHNIIDSDNDPLTIGTPTGLNEATVQIINNEPDIRVTGNGISSATNVGPDLVSGQTATSAADGTDFGSREVGTSLARFNYSVGNITPLSTLSILDANVQITGPNAGDFRFSPGLGSRTLSGNSTTGFAVIFQPTAVGLRQATISIGSNDPDENPFTFNISGTGTPSADVVPPTLVSIKRENDDPTANDTLVFTVLFSEPVLNFDNTDWVVTGSTATVTVGGFDAVRGYTIVASGGDLADLTGDVTVSLSPGQDITDAVGNPLVGLSPTGLDESTILVVNDASLTASPSEGQSATINTQFAQPLLATVTAANGDPVPDMVVFFTIDSNNGATAVLSDDSDVTDSNGVAQVTVTANGIVGGPYTVTATPRANPTGIADVANLQPVTFALTNLAAADTTPPRIASIVRQNPTTENTDADSLTWRVTFDESVQNVNGDATGDFTVAGVAGTTISVNAISDSIYDVTVSGGGLPNVNGVISLDIFNANLDIQDLAGNALVNLTVLGANENSYTLANAGQPDITVLGNGNTITDPDTSPDAADGTDFGNVTVNSDVGEQVFVIQNPGTAPLQITNIAFESILLGGNGNIDFSIVSPTTATIAIGGSFNLIVRFSPTSEGIAQDAIFIESNALNSTYVFNIQGTGVAPVDNVAPTVIDIDRTVANPTSADVITMVFRFSKTVQNFDPSDLILTGTTATVKSVVASLSNVGEFNVTYSGGDLANLNGDVTIGFSPSQDITDLAGNALVNTTPSGIREATITFVNVGPAANLTATSGGGQSANVTTAFGNVLVAAVTDDAGNPVENESVTFTAPDSGATGIFAGGGATETVTTDGSGLARSSVFTANSTAGTYDIVASASGLTSVNFTLTNNTTTPEITVFRGTIKVQTGDIVPLGNVVGISAGLSIRNDGAGVLTLGEVTILSATNLEDIRVTQPNNVSVASGASAQAGYNISPVTSGGPERSFTVSIPNNDADENPFLLNFTYASTTSGNIVAASGDGQTAAVNTAFGNAIVATVENRQGERIPGITVNFAAPSSGAGATLSATSTVTDANGEARVTAVANGTIGTYDVTASVAGLGTVTFALTNEAGAAATLVATSGGGQTTAVLTTFSNALVATVTDISGNPVPGESVTFTAPASGASGTFSGGGGSETVTTDASGVATSSSFVANSTIGDYAVTATSGSLSSVTFALTNELGAAATLVATSGGGQSAAVSTAFSNVFVAMVTDAGGNAVAGESVTFTAPASGASGLFSGGGANETVTTDTSGVATSSSFTANSTVGDYAVTATSGALSSVTFSLTNADNTPPSVTISDVPTLTTGAFTASFTFSEDVVGFVANDISVVNGSASDLSGSGTSYSALIEPDGNGDVSVSLAANVVTDPAGNGNIASAIQTTIVDDTPPEVEITIPDSASSSDSENPFTATFTFSEPVTNFELVDIGVEGGTLSNFVAQPGGLIYTVTVTPSLVQQGSTEGTTLTISIVAGSFADVAGNTNVEAKIALVRLDTIGPIVTLSAPPSEVKADFSLTATFSEDVINFEASDITVTNGSVEAFTVVGADEYQFTITPAELGVVTITIGQNVAEDNSGNGNQALENPAVTEFTFDAEAIRIRTQAIAHNFIARRADQLTAADPNLADRLQNQGSEKGFEGRLNGSGTLKLVNLSFDGAASGEALKLHRLVGADQAARIATWVQATLAAVESEDGSDTDQFFIHAGVDYRVSDDVLVGVLGQYDHAKQTRSKTLLDDGFEVSGDGYLVGPYTVVRLKDTLVFDGRVAWGQSTNEISPYNTYVDEFDTTRWLLKGQLTGQLNRKKATSDWVISPELALLYYKERQSEYTDSNGIVIGNQDVELGRLSFGPRISRTIKLGNGNNENSRTLLSTFSLRGIWDFKTPGLADLTTGVINGSDQFRARGQGGLTYTLNNGARLTFEGFYDGIGAESFNAYGGNIKVAMTY